MRRWPLVAAAAALCLAGCSTTSHPSASPATSAAVNAPSSATPSRTAPSSVINPDVIPPVITIPYVDAVFKVLNHINGNAARTIIGANSLTALAIADLKAIYSPPLLAVELRVFSVGLTQDKSNLRSPMGDRVTTVNKLIFTSSSCMFVETTTQLTNVEISPTAVPASEYWELERKSSIQDPLHLNPTPWALDYNADYMTPTNAPNICP